MTGTAPPAGSRAARGELARYWRHPGVAGVDVMWARFRRHRFPRHSHETFAVGVVETGAEELRIGGGTERVAAGGTVLLNPEVVHTGGPAHTDGWTYRVLYLPVDAVAAAAGGRGTPSFREPVSYDPDTAAVVRAAHRATETGDELASSCLLADLLTGLWRRYGTRPAPRTP
ncbi:AraC family ligand binding domain-containing protein, partial [Saccharomonospora iraqiensis]|uniref:AraC family ligand binding domain-containing protein n=1 Tax=Saccharomonospora iraqiensis TaxID=52698 RepID=UPI00022E0458